MGHQSRPKIRKVATGELTVKRLVRMDGRLQEVDWKIPTFKQTFDHLKFWHNGDLITKAEHDNLSWEEIHASSNRGNRRI